MHLVFHIRPQHFPVADGERLAMRLELQGEALTRVRVIKANTKTVLASYAVLRYSLRFHGPGFQLFPGDKNGLTVAFWHETDFTALAVEAGWGDFFYFGVHLPAEDHEKKQACEPTPHPPLEPQIKCLPEERGHSFCTTPITVTI